MGAHALALALLEQVPGKHQIKIALSIYSTYSNIFTDVIASGEFSLEITKSDHERLANAYTAPLLIDEWMGKNKEKII